MPKAILTAPIVAKNDEERFVYGPVLVPGEADTAGDVVSAGKIRQVAHLFLRRYANLDVMHTLDNVAQPVESYIAPVDLAFDRGDEMVLVPKGSWMMGAHVEDDDSWAKVASGELTGFSIMAVNPAVLKALGVSTKSAQGFGQAFNGGLLTGDAAGMVTKNFHRVTLADLDPEWIVTHVSLVDEPGVPKAKWVAIKRRSKDAAEKVAGAAPLPGSYQDLTAKINALLSQMFPSYENRPWVHSLFADHVVLELFDYNDAYGHQGYVDQPFEYDAETGRVAFTGAAQAIDIESVVVDAPDDLGALLASLDAGTAGSGSWKTFLASLIPGRASTKAGRVVSDSNYKRIKNAITALTELLEIAEAERSEKRRQPDKEVDVTPEEFKGLIAEGIAPVVEKVEALAKKVDEIDVVKKQGPKDTDQDAEDEIEEELPPKKPGPEHDPATGEPGAGTGESITPKALAEFEERITALEAVVAKRRLGGSNRLAGQEGEQPVVVKDFFVDDDRDSMGYKKRASA